MIFAETREYRLRETVYQPTGIRSIADKNICLSLEVIQHKMPNGILRNTKCNSSFLTCRKCAHEQAKILKHDQQSSRKLHFANKNEKKCLSFVTKLIQILATMSSRTSDLELKKPKRTRDVNRKRTHTNTHSSRQFYDH